MALKIDVLQAANAMDALEVAIRAEHARMTIDDMLKLSTNAAAGRTGLPCTMKYRQIDNFAVCAGIAGGLLFENFVATTGKRTNRRAILALAKLCLQEQRECTDLEADTILADERVGFFSFVLMSLSNRGRSANRQLFFMSLLVQARGLSRSGMEFQSRMNVCLAPRTFDLELATFLNTVELRERFAHSVIDT